MLVHLESTRLLSATPSSAASPRCYNMHADTKTDSDLSLTLSPSTSVLDSEDSALQHALYAFSRSVDPPQLGAHAAALSADFEQALREGLALSMLPNHSILPTGDEHGDFLVVDLGGSTLRVAVISVAPPQAGARKDRIRIVVLRKWTVDDTRKTVDGGFFAWIAARVAETLAQQSVLAGRGPLAAGITWLFPLQATSHNLGNVLHMGKGYVVLDAVSGRDLNALVTEALAALGIAVQVRLIVNDSLAVYAAAAFLDATTQMAMVLGTGLNMCCQLDLAGLPAAKQVAGELRVLLNTETSLFGASLVAPFATAYDAAIDARFASALAFRPHMELDLAGAIFQPSELLTSGRYLPELVRLVLAELAAKGEVFGGIKNLAALHTPYAGITGQLVCFVSETEENSAIAGELACSLGWDRAALTVGDVAAVKLVVDAVVRRAAYIVAAAVVACLQLLHRHNGPFASRTVAIGYVGLVMEYFHVLRTAIAAYANGCPELVALGVHVELRPVSDSSLVGAAIGAATRSIA